MAMAALGTKNAVAYPANTVPHGTLVSLTFPLEAASLGQGPADIHLDNVDDLAGIKSRPASTSDRTAFSNMSTGSSDQLHHAQNISQPSFTNLPLQEETQLWDNISSVENNSALWQPESDRESDPRGQLPLHALHDQYQNQIFDGTLGDTETMPTNLTWLWPGNLHNNVFLPYFESGSQFRTTRPDSIIKELELGGFSNINPSEPVYQTDLGPQYQTPAYGELLHPLDLFDNAALPHGFDPILSHFVTEPLAGTLDWAANSPRPLLGYGNEIYNGAVNFQGFSNSLAAFSQTRMDDIRECGSTEWMPPKLLPYRIEGVAQTAKRPRSDDCLQPIKCPRNHRSTTSVHMVSAMGQPASQTTKKFCQVAKRSNQDFDMPPSESARPQKAMTPCADSNMDRLSQAFQKALAEILPPNSPRKQPLYPCPSNDALDGSVGGFQSFQIKLHQPVVTKIQNKAIRAAAQSSENVCLQCKVRKKQCITTNGIYKSQTACMKCLDLVNGDEVLAKKLCVRPKDLNIKLVNPDIFFESYAVVAQRIPAPLSPTIQRRVAIYMTCVVKEIPHMPLSRALAALICNVEECKIKGSDDVAIEMVKYQTFNDLRYRQVEHIHSRKMPSVGIPERQVPKLPNLIKWTTSSLALAPGGAVLGLHGPIYQFATLYIKREDRPLRSLVEIAVRYTAVYNVCIGQMSLQLSPASPVLYNVPPKLRVQICQPLLKYHTELGEQLQMAMLKALYGSHGPEKGEHVPLCIVWWLIMNVFGHNLDDSAAAAFLYYGIRKLDANYFEYREEILPNLSTTHQAIYHAIFGRDPKSFCPIFNDALIKLCHIEDTDTELLEKLQSLRTAVRQFKDDAAARTHCGRAQGKLEHLTGLFCAINLEQHQPSPPDPNNETNAAAEVAEDVDDDAHSISSSCLLYSRISGPERDESLAKIKTKAVEAVELKAYWLARCMQVYDNQAWLFGY